MRDKSFEGYILGAHPDFECSGEAGFGWSGCSASGKGGLEAELGFQSLPREAVSNSAFRAAMPFSNANNNV